MTVTYLQHIYLDVPHLQLSTGTAGWFSGKTVISHLLNRVVGESACHKIMSKTDRAQTESLEDIRKSLGKAPGNLPYHRSVINPHPSKMV